MPSARATATASGDQGVSAAALPDGSAPGASDAADNVTAAAASKDNSDAADVARVARAGELMPQKSTYFFPKLLTGVAFHPLVDA